MNNRISGLLIYTIRCLFITVSLACRINVLNVFIDIQTSKELIQMDTDKMMTYGTFTMDDEKLTQSFLNRFICLVKFHSKYFNCN